MNPELSGLRATRGTGLVVPENRDTWQLYRPLWSSPLAEPPPRQHSRRKKQRHLSRCEIPFPGRVLFPAKNRSEGRASGAFTQPRSWKSERPDTGGPIPNWEITRGATSNRFLVPCAGHFAKILPWTHFFCLSLFRHIFTGMWILILTTHDKKTNGNHQSIIIITFRMLLLHLFFYLTHSFSFLLVSAISILRSNRVFHTPPPHFGRFSLLLTKRPFFSKTVRPISFPFLLKRKRIVLAGAYSTEKDPFHGFPIFESSQ